jgi:PAS domain S-box-containing protein
MNEILDHLLSAQMTRIDDGPAAGDASSTPTPVVLIVDDDADIRDILRRLLKRESYTLLEAENGVDALAVCRQQPADLILLDIMMPVMDGVAACARIRELPGQAHVPILMLTVLKDTGSITRAFEAGATDYITKPIDAIVLRHRVRHLLRISQAETRLRLSEQKYRGFVEQASDGFMLTDENGRLIEWNRALEQMTGYTAAEVVGRAMADVQRLLVPDADDNDAYRRMAELQHQPGFGDGRKTHLSRDLIIRHRSGTPRAVHEITFPIETANGYRLGSVVRDVTDRRTMEAALRASEERYRLITENMNDAVFLMDLQWNVTYISPIVERTFGYTLAEFKQRDIQHRLLAPHSQELIDRFFATELTSDHFNLSSGYFPRSFEVECYRRDGSALWCELTFTLVRDSQGRPSGIVGVGRDITERKQAEDKVLQLNANLLQRARELGALNTAGRALTSSLDLRQVLHTVVREIQNLLEAERSAVLLRDPAHDDLIFAAVAGEGSAVLLGTRVPIGSGIAGWVAREGRPALVDEAHRDPRFWSRADAKTGYLTHSIVAVPIEFRGVIWGVAEAINRRDGSFGERDQEMLAALASSAAIAIENARLYQVEREQFQRLQESQARLVHAEKMSALGRLVASLTHEINNPLQAIQSGLYIMHEELSSLANRTGLQRDLQIIEDEVKRIANLMGRLREFSRPVRLESRPTDLHGLLENILNLVSAQLQQQRILIEKHWDSQLPIVLASPDQLTQVFMNLVLNAIDAMPEGGTLSITTGHEQTETVPLIVQLAVTDTGVGIHPTMLKHVFEPFVTTKANGTGLGLAISYETIQSLGGEISVSSELTVGTTFNVKLPLHAAA